MGSFPSTRPNSEPTEPIAIVGVGCWLPGGIFSAAELLQTLRTGRDCVSEIPPDRWNADEFYDPDPLTPGKTYVRHGGFVDDIDRFDAAFFGVSDGEASRMDPQQRMALQTVWHALEDAGQAPRELEKSNTGFFLAMMNTNGYSQMKGVYEGMDGVVAYDAMGDAMSITAGRVSHFLGLEGPCFALDTACSGSLVATHLARQSILSGECDSAIVAGVSSILHPGIHVAFSKVGLMSRVGRCQAFDASADGYVRGEGCMAVVLRRQSVAEARGDRILASIVSTAINQDGRTPALTAPNGETQEKVIRMALARGGVSPSEIGYVEAHGTGTPVGDPIEMTALANVYGPERTEDMPLYVGSAKTNFGHIESGAGLLGLVKAALSVSEGEVFPSLHFRELNPNIQIGQAPISVPVKSRPWPNGVAQRMAGVNSFGYSGTNAHAILRQSKPVETENPAPVRPAELLVLSAKASGSLSDLAESWEKYLEKDPPATLGDLAFTAATGRAQLRHRLAVVGVDKKDWAEKLKAWRAGRTPQGVVTGQAKLGRSKPKVAFVFTGQGSQYAGMGRELYETEPLFREAFDRCATHIDAEMDQPLREVVFGERSAELLSNTRYVQPALFAIEYALAETLRKWGVEPDMVIGHSVGELVAACVAGALRLADAARFVVVRGRLMGGLPEGGAMLALDATREQVEDWIAGKEDEIAVATVNGPRSIVVSGTEDAVAEIDYVATTEGCRTKRLEVSHAFHSPLMEPILAELEQTAASFRPSTPRIPLISNVTGEPFDGPTTPDYWSSHVRKPVLFHQGMQRLIDDHATVLVEIGPHAALTPAIAASFDVSKLRLIPTLVRGQKDFASAMTALGALFSAGVPLQLERLFWNPAYQRTPAPLYPFRRDRHWLRVNLAREGKPKIEIDLHPLLGRAIGLGTSRTIFETNLRLRQPWVDHRVLGTTVFPGAAYLEMAARGFAASRGKDWQPVKLKEIGFDRPLLLKYGKKGKDVTLTLADVPANRDGEVSFNVAAKDNGERYCQGLAVALDQDVKPAKLPIDLNRHQPLAVGEFYGELRKAGLEYGASFSTVREIWTGPEESGEAVGRVSTSAQSDVASNNPYSMSVLLDGCLQVFGAALQTLGANDLQGAFVPASVGAVTLLKPLPAQVWSQVTVVLNSDGRAALARIRITSDEGDLLADIQGLEIRRTQSLSVSAAGANGSEPIDRAAASESRAELLKKLESQPRDEQIAVLSAWLAAEVKDTLGQAAEDIDLDEIEPSTVFLEIGLDSLMVTELQRRIQEKLSFRFQAMQGLDYQSIESLAEFILSDVLKTASADSKPAHVEEEERAAVAEAGD